MPRFVLQEGMLGPAPLAGVLALTLSLPVYAASNLTCRSHSPPTVVPVVELYTSEGCSSCPPADKWISKLRHEPHAVVLSFHVDYWDYLGWRDRFAQPRFSQRQREQLQVNSARNPYTPQVVINGVDAPRWYGQPAKSILNAPPKASVVSLTMHKEGDLYTATVLGLSSAPAQLAAYWAVTEGPQKTSVKAGENRGEVLSHDFIVRDFQAVNTWRAGAGGLRELSFKTQTPRLDGSVTRHVNLVVVDAQTGRPLQALKLDC